MINKIYYLLCIIKKNLQKFLNSDYQLFNNILLTYLKNYRKNNIKKIYIYIYI